MQNIISVRDIIKQLSKSGLQIGDKSILHYHIKNFNFNTFVYGYSDPFYVDKQNKRYDRDANSNEMINLYKFDRDMSNHILRYILVIEKIINTNVAYSIINHFDLRDKCLFKLNQTYIQEKVLPNLRDVEPRVTYSIFIKKLIKYLPSSNITKHYCKRNIYDDVLKWKECPLDIMCLTWSFATSFSIFISLPNDARISLLSNFDLSPEHYEGFIVFLKNTLHLRNYISHNNVIYNTEIACQSPSLINLYECVFNKSVSNIRLLHMMELIEHFSHSTTLVSNTRYYLSKLKVQQKFKDKIQLYEDMVNGQKTLQE